MGVIDSSFIRRILISHGMADYDAQMVLVDIKAEAKKREEPMTGRFWMIVRDPSLAKYTDPPHPRKVYRTITAAKRDIAALVSREGKRFYLLQAVEFAEPATAPVAWHPTDMTALEESNTDGTDY